MRSATHGRTCGHCRCRFFGKEIKCGDLNIGLNSRVISVLVSNSFSVLRGSSVVKGAAQFGHKFDELPVRMHRQQPNRWRDRHRRIAQRIRSPHQRHRRRTGSDGNCTFGILLGNSNKNCVSFLRQLERAKDQFIGPLENFRKEHIGGAKVRACLNEVCLNLMINWILFSFSYDRRRRRNLRSRRPSSSRVKSATWTYRLRNRIPSYRRSLICSLASIITCSRQEFKKYWYPISLGGCDFGDGTAPLLPGQSRVRLPLARSPRTQKIRVCRNGTPASCPFLLIIIHFSLVEREKWFDGFTFLSVKQLLGFMYGWLTFYHQGYEVAKEFRPYMTDLQVRLQKVCGNLEGKETLQTGLSCYIVFSFGICFCRPGRILTLRGKKPSRWCARCWRCVRR